MLAPLAIDYAAARRALVAAIALGTGLDPSKIVRTQAQGPQAPRPMPPSCTFSSRTVSMRTGFRDSMLSAPDISPTAVRYAGTRGMAVDLNFFGRDQDEAYNLAVIMQAALYRYDLLQGLTAAGWAIYKVGDVTDITALLNTGFEGRALLEMEMWTRSVLLVDPGVVESAQVIGNVQTDYSLEN